MYYCLLSIAWGSTVFRWIFLYQMIFLSFVCCKVSLHFIFKNCTCFKILSLCNPYQCRCCASKCFVLKALTMVLPSLNFYRDYLWILLKTTIIVTNYFLPLFHFEYLCKSTRSAVQVLFIAYIFVTFEWSLQKNSTSLWTVLK